MITTDHKALKHIYRELIEIVTAAVNEWDPYALIKGGAPEDEFSEEVSRIAAKVLDIKSPTELSELISSIFSEEFETEDSVEECMQVASQIFDDLQNRGILEQKNENKTDKN